MSRKISIIVSLLLVSLLLAIPVFATTGSGSAAASAETVQAGDVVEVVYSIQGFEKVNALSVSFTVPAGLKLESAQWLIAGTIVDVNTDKGQAVWTKADAVDMTASTPVFKLSLKVLEGTQDASYKVSFESNVKLDATLLGNVSASASFSMQKPGCAHSLKEVAAKAPDCKNTGNNLYYVCENCGKVFAADKVTETTVAAQTLAVTSSHSYADTWTADSTGHWHACKVCGAKADVAAHKMKWVEDLKPTESSEGKKHQTCEICAYNAEAVAIEKLNHAPALVKGQAPTCTVDGVIDHFYCSNCDGYYASVDGKIGEKITKDDLVAKATGHAYATVWSSDEQSHWHECKCGAVADKADHAFELVGKKEATADKAGYTGDEVCKVCQYVGEKGEEIPRKDTGSTTPDTEPTEPATEPTEPDTEPTTPSTEPTVPDTEPTTPSTEPTAPDAEPTTPATVPTETQPAQPEEPVEKQNDIVLWIIPLIIIIICAVVAFIVIKRKRR